MREPLIFDSISISVPKKDIYHRLGYRDRLTYLKPLTQKEIEHEIIEAVSFVELKGVALRTTVVNNQEGKVTFSEGITFKSNLLSSLLGGCNEALWCAATAGRGIVQQIHESEKNNLRRAVIFDAVASEMTDSALDWIVDYINGVLRRENKQLTAKRISCGYADFDIAYQKTIYEMLKLKMLKIEITETCMLVPEKSVTAVLGIRDILLDTNRHVLPLNTLI